MTADVTRVSTGIRGLDQVLGGGILPGSVVFLVGAPGTGKTLLAQSISFHFVAAGARVLYFTALSEPHGKLLTHVREFAFFDESAIGDRLQLLNLEQMLRQGAEETADAIVQMARANRASLVVLDGFRSIMDFAESPTRAREFLYQLSAKFGVLGTSCLVTLEADPHDTALHSETTMADVIVGLWYQPADLVRSRFIEVLKSRGSPGLPGQHSFVIAPEGLACFPQAETLPVAPSPGLAAERSPFGLPALDAMLNGGLTRGSSTVLNGEMGVGKTLLALTWLYHGALQGESGLLFGFHEGQEQLIDKARTFGIELREPIERGLISFWTMLPVAVDPNRIADVLRQRIAAAGVRRLVIDSERELLHMLSPQRVDAYLTALVGYLRGEQVTSLIVREMPAAILSEVEFSGTPTALLAESVMLMRRFVHERRLRYAIAVLKMRFSAFDLQPHLYTLGERGIEVDDEVTDVAGALRGIGSSTGPWPEAR